jgi:hypothetical protein
MAARRPALAVGSNNVTSGSFSRTSRAVSKKVGSKLWTS